MCILAIEGQYAVFLQPEFPSGCTIGVTAVADAWITGSICCLLEWQTTPFFFFLYAQTYDPFVWLLRFEGTSTAGLLGNTFFFSPDESGPQGTKAFYPDCTFFSAFE